MNSGMCGATKIWISLIVLQCKDNLKMKTYLRHTQKLPDRKIQSEAEVG